jgi:catechol 2,3-dioxygenase-like lactoylglutathione lyase family enzyme
MQLGAFSIGLSVNDLEKSKQFYEKLGFSILRGSIEEGFLIMKNESCLIGLYHEMADKLVLTFNPGWNNEAKNTEDYTDIRGIQNELIKNGTRIETETFKKNSYGKAKMLILDPDGNKILFDQIRDDKGEQLE